MKKQMALLILIMVFPLPILTQTVVWEKVYRVDTLKSLSFNRLDFFPTLDNQYFYSVDRQIRNDTNYLVFTKLDKEGNLLLAKPYRKVVGGKLKQIYYSNLPLKFESKDGKNYICAVNFVPMAASLGYSAGFWLYVTKFDIENGELVFEGIDTISKHTFTISPQGPGRVFELNNLYYNFSLTKDTILLKIFSLNGDFVSEKRVSKMYLPEGSYYFSESEYLEVDSSFFFVLQKEGPILKYMNTYLVNINKELELKLLHPIIIEGDTVKILALKKNKMNKLIAICFKDADSTTYITELDLDGSITNVKQLDLDKRIQLRKINQISDGGYVLLGQYRTTRDTSMGVFIKISNNFEIEQVFSQRLEAPWKIFNEVLELPDHSFLIAGSCDYYPYLLKLKDVIVSVEKKADKQATNISQIVNDYLDLSGFDGPFTPQKKISIYSVEGVKLFEGFANSRINVEKFVPGVYFLMIEGKVYKFLKL